RRLADEIDGDDAVGAERRVELTRRRQARDRPDAIGARLAAGLVAGRALRAVDDERVARAEREAPLRVRAVQHVETGFGVGGDDRLAELEARDAGIAERVVERARRR